MDTGYKILLTGGSGFLGTAIINELLDADSPLPLKALRVMDLQAPADMGDARISFMQGDVSRREAVSQACAGMDLVFHAAAIVDWGTKSEKEIMEVNYQATLNMIEACKANEVKALVFTSSLDVLFDGNPLVDVDEETPYPEKHSTSYCRSKYLAELAVLKANGEGLKTCSIRPSDIYGERDPYHIGSLIDMARGGFYVRLGNGRSRCQHVYVGNIAQAHVLAAADLLKEKSRAAGQAYFITDGPGTNFFKFFDSIVEGSGYRIWPKNLWLPRGFGYTLGSISESIAFLLRPIYKYSPKMSRFAVTYTCTDYTFNSDKARRDFGFIPKYSSQEAFERTVKHYQV